MSIYPITADGSLLSTLIYQMLYASLIVADIIVAHDTPRQTAVLIILGVVWLISGAIYAFNQTETWVLLLGYGAIFPFQLMVVRVLLRYIFNTRDITRDVLYTAVAVYLLLGALFVPVYGLLETTQPGSFVDNVAGGAFIPWQTFTYYSYVTLTTLGFGDILPVSMWARALVTLEAVIGVLYLTIIMARLVGLYAQEVLT